MRVTSKLNKLMLWYDYTIVCDDIKGVYVHKEDSEFGDMVQRQIEILNPIEYTREELLKKYSGKEVVIKWVHTFTEKGENAIAVVLENSQ